MIDLRERWLPSHIDVGDVRYALDTDFRTWIKFQDAMENEGIADYCIFKGRKPPVDDVEWVGPALDFMRSDNATPNFPSSGDDTRTIDLVLDGDYIVASFMDAYGINLTEVDYMHWHVFKALLNGLPSKTKMSEIIGYRAWKKSTKKYEQTMREMRDAWTLPDRGAEQAMEEARAMAELLYEQMGA